jgi:uncharacterized sulfatase
MEEIMAMAEKASMLKPEALPELRKAMKDEDSAVRYWGAMGVLMRGKDAVETARADLVAALEDSSPSVRAIAGEALTKYGSKEEFDKAMPALLDVAENVDTTGYAALLAVNAIDDVDGKAGVPAETIRELDKVLDKKNGQAAGYVKRVMQKIMSDLNA